MKFLMLIGFAGLAGSANAGTLTTLHQFTGGSDGANPTTPLIIGGGHIYGTTPLEKLGFATIFGVDPGTGDETQVFVGPNKKFFSEGPLAYENSLIYGENGRDIFTVDPATGAEQSLVSFGAISGLFSGNGVLYGTNGGPFGLGAIFEVNPETKAVTTLYDFQGQTQGDGEYPVGGLTVEKHLIYGATGSGGTYGYGTLYSFDLRTQKETVLYSFTGGDDGGGPVAQPVLVHGVLYGATTDATSGLAPTLYAFNLATGTKTVLYRYMGGTNAEVLVGQLCYKSGHLYGVSAAGGAHLYGSIYEVDIASGAERIIYSFNKGDSNGYSPEAGLIYVNGAFYGTTRMGNETTYYGTVFRFTP